MSETSLPVAESPYKFGKKIACTQAQFDEKISHLYASTTLDGVGDFYLAHGKNADGITYTKDVFLYFYDKERQTMHRSMHKLFTSVRELNVKCMALNETMFAIGANQWKGICMMMSDWSDSYYETINNDHIPGLCSFLDSSHPTEIHKTGLSRIRDGTPGDFTLNSKDGESVVVHKTVVQPLWPFIAAAVDSKMVESEQNAIDMPFSKSTIEAAVRYLYGQELKLNFEDAANLVVMAQMYDLPELLKLAVERVKSETMDVTQSILLWQKAFEAKNDNLREFCAKNIKNKRTDVSNTTLLEDLDRDEVVELFVDVSKV